MWPVESSPWTAQGPLVSGKPHHNCIPEAQESVGIDPDSGVRTAWQDRPRLQKPHEQELTPRPLATTELLEM